MADFNTAIPEVVSSQQGLGRDVHFVDQFTPLNNDYANLIRGDNLHTNTAGNASLANQWFNSIESVSSVPEPSSSLVLGLAMVVFFLRQKRTTIT